MAEPRGEIDKLVGGDLGRKHRRRHLGGRRRWKGRRLDLDLASLRGRGRGLMLGLGQTRGLAGSKLSDSFDSPDVLLGVLAGMFGFACLRLWLTTPSAD
jgi:hypothetical protein